jgi:hypothetical protein
VKNGKWCVVNGGREGGCSRTSTPLREEPLF